MEIWDAYDKDFNKIEDMTLIRGEEASIPVGIYHLVCNILVQHKDGTYLLMQRDPGKAYPLLWEASAGGSALKGESAYESAVRELFEETGIRSEIPLKEISRAAKDETHSAYVDFFIETDCDKDSVVLQEGETVDYRWVTKKELIKMRDKVLINDRLKKYIGI